MIINKEEIKALIPHSGKMLLLSNIIYYNLDEGSLTAEFHITEDCIFFNSDAGGVPAWAAFECIAQSYAAFSRIRDRETKVPAAASSALCNEWEEPSRSRAKPTFGYILSVSKMQIFFPVIKPGSTIIIKVKELESMDLVNTFEGTVFLEDKKVLEGKITVMTANEGDSIG